MAYLNINGQDIEGIASFSRAISHNSDVITALDFSRAVDTFNFAAKKSYSFVTKPYTESELATIETILLNIGQIPVTITLDDDVIPRVVIITKGSIKMTSIGGMYDEYGNWNKGSGKISFGCDEI